MQAVVLTSFLFLGILSIQALPTGHKHSPDVEDNVLLSACQTLLPLHPDNSTGKPHEPQNGVFPYTVTANATQIKPHDKIQVTIAGINGATFKGFMTQARNGDKIYGSFESDGTIGLIDCPGGKQNTATTRIHVDREDKKSITFTWIAPEELPEYIEFVTTIVKDYATFWVAQKSEKISAVKKN